MDALEHPNAISVSNEEKSSATRETVDGRRLTYHLAVVQEPKRARACGSGQKSSADRRPVDPPPIVELKIFEEKVPGAQPEDVTFRTNANYFLFATLEQARPIAHGRVSQERQQAPTVLTGTPVAGITYLDRPRPAGYFIFPDLSVRHEGKYRLSFSLYEEVKEAADQDKDAIDPKANSSNGGHVTHRVDVRSTPFTVYSAKKFPGLSSSTALSRMVAEQGCRVRIRRDVRLRKRDSKAGKDWNSYEEDTAQARARLSVTPLPEQYGYPALGTPHGSIEVIPRPRSASNTSHQSLAPSISRRPSLQDLNQSHQQAMYGGTPSTPTHTFTQPGSFGPSPTAQFAQPPYMQQQPNSMPPPPPQFPQSYGPPQIPGSASSASFYGATVAPYPEPNRPSVEYSAPQQLDYSRAPVQQMPQQPSVYNPQAYQQQIAPQQAYPQAQPQFAPNGPYSRNVPQSYSSSYDTSGRPVPLEPVQPTASVSGIEPSMPKSTNTLPPLNTSVLSNKLEAASPISAGPSSYYGGSLAANETSHKRSYGNVFPSTSGFNQPLKAGARPNSPYDTFSNPVHGFTTTAADDDDEDAECDVSSTLNRIPYRRADGKFMSRPHFS
ncbi:hypothetical protein K431DRAFT_34774 [Polychaeton citri CBS 116435]|uniref:Velvet domain-containing protein n=1 Tax=Polychaeton citri CBS 116435 TaxID=1314669 RepID=A0A9P4UP91_9PEZI|nr:hypothetical protein K431DRAFT_34774 [Polychaeton citri CBS 116435]